MFEKIYAMQGARKTAVSFSEISARNGMSFSEVAADLKQRGEISKDDPRSRLDPARIRKYAEMTNTELMSHYGGIVEQKFRNSSLRDDRVRYAAVVRAGEEHFDLLRSGATGSLARLTESQAIAMARANPADKSAQDMLHISAALSDKAQRERAIVGFATKDGRGNIAKAAKDQGRSWIEVRDDLVKFEVLDAKDPRRKVRVADIDFQKGGSINPQSTASAVDLEAQAMARLSKNPRDEQATGWLASAGALQGPKEAQKPETAISKKKSLFGRDTTSER